MAIKVKDKDGNIVKVPSLKDTNDRITTRLTGINKTSLTGDIIIESADSSELVIKKTQQTIDGSIKDAYRTTIKAGSNILFTPDITDPANPKLTINSLETVTEIFTLSSPGLLSIILGATTTVSSSDLTGEVGATPSKGDIIVDTAGTNAIIQSINGTNVTGVTTSIMTTQLAWGGLTGNITNQTDLSTALGNKVDKVSGYNLVLETEITKLSHAEDYAQKNVQSNWGEDDPTEDAYIIGKPNISESDITNLNTQVYALNNRSMTADVVLSGDIDGNMVITKYQETLDRSESDEYIAKIKAGTNILFSATQPNPTTTELTISSVPTVTKIFTLNSPELLSRIVGNTNTVLTTDLTGEGGTTPSKGDTIIDTKGTNAIIKSVGGTNVTAITNSIVVDQITWGNITGTLSTQTDLSDALSNKVDKAENQGLMTKDEKDKLKDIAAGAQVNVQSDWDEDDTTADSYINGKPKIGNATIELWTGVSSTTPGTKRGGFNLNDQTPTYIYLETTKYVEKETNKFLMTKDEQDKLNAIASGAQVNVQSDWSQTDSDKDDYIKFKPTIGEGILNLYKESTTTGTPIVTFGANYTSNENIALGLDKFQPNSYTAETSTINKILTTNTTGNVVLNDLDNSINDLAFSMAIPSDTSTPTDVGTDAKTISHLKTIVVWLRSGINYVKGLINSHTASTNENPHNVTLSQAAIKQGADNLILTNDIYKTNTNTGNKFALESYVGEGKLNVYPGTISNTGTSFGEFSANQADTSPVNLYLDLGRFLETKITDTDKILVTDSTGAISGKSLSSDTVDAFKMTIPAGSDDPQNVEQDARTGYLVNIINWLRDGIRKVNSTLTSHTSSTSNPHSVTLSQADSAQTGDFIITRDIYKTDKDVPGNKFALEGYVKDSKITIYQGADSSSTDLGDFTLNQSSGEDIFLNLDSKFLKSTITDTDKILVTDSSGNITGKSLSSGTSDAINALKMIIPADSSKADVGEAQKTDFLVNIINWLRSGIRKNYTDLSTHTSSASNPHSVTLDQAETAQAGTDLVINHDIYKTNDTDGNQFLTKSEIDEAITDTVQGTSKYMGQLKFGADTVATMNTINTSDITVDNEDLCGVQETQKTYKWNASASTWDEQPHGNDEKGQYYEIVFWFGAWLDGITYHGDVSAKITCYETDPDLIWHLIVYVDKILDGEVTDNKIGNRTISSPTPSADFTSKGPKKLQGWLDQFYSNLSDLVGRFNTTTGHDHDGTDSKKISYNNLEDTPDIGDGTLTIKVTGETDVVFKANQADTNPITVSFAKVANTGAYGDLSGTPSAPGDGTLTIYPGTSSSPGTEFGNFKANQADDSDVNLYLDLGRFLETKITDTDKILVTDSTGAISGKSLSSGTSEAINAFNMTIPADSSKADVGEAEKTDFLVNIINWLRGGINKNKGDLNTHTTTTSGNPHGVTYSDLESKLAGADLVINHDIYKTDKTDGNKFALESYVGDGTITIEYSDSTVSSPQKETFTLNSSSDKTIPLHKVARTGNLADLNGSPAINDGTLTLYPGTSSTDSGTAYTSFTANDSDNVNIYLGLTNKVDKDGNKVLSTNDFIDDYESFVKNYTDSDKTITFYEGKNSGAQGSSLGSFKINKSLTDTPIYIGLTDYIKKDSTKGLSTNDYIDDDEAFVHNYTNSSTPRTITFYSGETETLEDRLTDFTIDKNLTSKSIFLKVKGNYVATDVDTTNLSNTGGMIYGNHATNTTQILYRPINLKFKDFGSGADINLTNTGGLNPKDAYNPLLNKDATYDSPLQLTLRYYKIPETLIQNSIVKFSSDGKTLVAATAGTHYLAPPTLPADTRLIQISSTGTTSTLNINDYDAATSVPANDNDYYRLSKSQLNFVGYNADPNKMPTTWAGNPLILKNSINYHSNSGTLSITSLANGTGTADTFGQYGRNVAVLILYASGGDINLNFTNMVSRYGLANCVFMTSDIDSSTYILNIPSGKTAEIHFLAIDWSTNSTPQMRYHINAIVQPS